MWTKKGNCPYCGKNKNENEKCINNFGRHLLICEKNPMLEEIKRKRADKKRKIRKTFKFNCIKCKKEYEVNMLEWEFNVGRYNKTCSKKCSTNRMKPKVLFEKISKYKKREFLSEEEKFLNKFKFLNKSKKEVFSSSKSWQSARGSIQKCARYIYNNFSKDHCCLKCGYNKHYEVCHVKSVSSFDENINVLLIINNINNLIALCPTHHWEFDNGILKIDGIFK